MQPQRTVCVWLVFKSKYKSQDAVRQQMTSTVLHRSVYGSSQAISRSFVLVSSLGASLSINHSSLPYRHFVEDTSLLLWYRPFSAYSIIIASMNECLSPPLPAFNRLPTNHWRLYLNRHLQSHSVLAFPLQYPEKSNILRRSLPVH